MFVSRATLAYVGLFDAIASGSRIETLGVTNAYVEETNFVGIPIGESHGIIVTRYPTGKVNIGFNGGGLEN